MTPGQMRERGVSNGAHAHGLLQAQCQRLVELHAPVLRDQDPEPLHQMRVSLRRLSTTLVQFAPCLVLPKGLSEKQLAKTVRQLGMARDLDVLQERLDDMLLPQLPEQERQRLKPARRQLARERRAAHGQLCDVLQSGRHLKWIAAIQAWLKQPAYTTLGEQPLLVWLPEWAVADSLSLFLHPGWWLETAAQNPDSLHDLRKQLKWVRYRLENIEGFAGSGVHIWISQLKRGQGLLGELNDLCVLEEAINDQCHDSLETTAPQFVWLLEQHRLHCWRRWRQLCEELMDSGSRRRRLAALARLGEGASIGRRWARALIDFPSRLR